MTESQRTVDADRVVIFDTTLRDGEQSPGCSMTVDEKLRVAEVLEAMGVDVIEAGFPIASEGDFEAVQAIAKRIKDSVVCGLARANAADIAYVSYFNSDNTPSTLLPAHLIKNWTGIDGAGACNRTPPGDNNRCGARAFKQWAAAYG